MAPTVYLVSGANRGIGLALVTVLAARANTIVFAGARSPSGATALRKLEVQHPSKLYTVQLTSADREDNDAAVAKIKQIAGRLDIVVANAGINSVYERTDVVSVDAMKEHYEVNVLGPLVLFQATRALLKASTPSPKLMIVSSRLGSIEWGPGVPFPCTPYGTSKAAVNWLAVKLYYEHPELTVVAISPGLVATDMAASAAAYDPTLGGFPTITPEQSAAGVIKLLDEGKRGEKAPVLTSYDGTVYPW
ncbi:NAD(P)-binding protein [Calocera viscosa TUFC12733]|uniref:NAD(P)-binding protein n=1 Tax=Calocera viscosa (strain TUFC12733) TaxID=1330018 RepID=A0A167I779_CALVF|nr:NAD(P)-binding protein [Calocera viscosa TUFC12733]